MALLDAKVFYEKVQAGENRSLFLFGDESYLLKQAYKFVLSTYQINTEDVFNFENFDLFETPWERISESISQLPMMADFRTIIIRGAELLGEKDLEQVEKDLVAKDPIPLLVFLSSDIDKKKKIYKILSTKCLSCEFKPPYENQIPQWVHYMAEQKGLKINQDAVHTLVQLVGANLSELNAELEKVELFVSPNKTIEEDKVREVLGKTRQDTVFAFIDELFAKHHTDALIMMADLVQNGQSEVGMVSLLARHLRILLQTQKGSDEGLRGQALATQVGVSPYFLGKYLQQSHLWSPQDLQRLLAALAETETQLKSSSVPNRFLMEKLALEFYRVSNQDKIPFHSA